MTDTKEARRDDKSIKPVRTSPSHGTAIGNRYRGALRYPKSPVALGSWISRLEIMATIVINMTAEKSERYKAARRELDCRLILTRAVINNAMPRTTAAPIGQTLCSTPLTNVRSNFAL